MKSTEQEIRIALGNDFGNRVKEFYSNPGQAAAFRYKLEGTISKVLDELVQIGEIETEQRIIFEESLSKSLMEEYGTDKMSQHAADVWIKNKQDYEGMAKKFNTLAVFAETEVSSELNSTIEKILVESEKRDEIVADLVELAESGDRINTYDLHNAIRRKYETAEDYLAASNKFVELAEDMVNELVNVIFNGDVTMQKLTQSIVKEVLDLYKNEFVKADVDAIYNI